MSDYKSPLKTALCEFKKKGITIKKESDNPFFKSKYADLATILDAVEAEAAKCGLTIFSQIVLGEQIVLTTTLSHKDSDEVITSSFPVFGSKPQEIGSSVTYARRYNIQSLLNLAAEDDDGNEANKAAPTAKQVYGTNAAMKKKYTEILNAIKSAQTEEQLKDVWLGNASHIKAIIAMDEQYKIDLEAAKDRRKLEIASSDVINEADEINEMENL